MADAGMDLDSALAAWREQLGGDWVLRSREALAPYGRTTAPGGHLPAAALLPENADEVAALVATARRYRVPLYPISQGKNWGYGDASPAGPGQVLVDLHRLNRIIFVDPGLAYALIEPGVTQGQLAAYLREQDLPLWVDCTGAGPDTSLVGNILERGFGHSPYGNRAEHVAGMEVVLASGERLRTGFGHYDAAATHTYPPGVGPELDGLFFQSNLGIVVSLGVWLMPQAERTEQFLCFLEEPADLAPAVEALRRLRLAGILNSVVHIGNDLRAVSGSRSRDPDAPAGPLDPEQRRRLRESTGMGVWNLSGSLQGTAAQVRVARREVRRRLKGPRRRLVFLGPAKLAWADRIAGLLGDSRAGHRLRARIESARALLGLSSGQPSRLFLRGAYWRNPEGLPADFPTRADPAADGCGLLWVAPILPLRGTDVDAFLRLAEPVVQRHGFDFMVTLSAVNPRSLAAVLSLSFDRADEEEAERAGQCHDQLVRLFLEQGYPLYRAGLRAMPQLIREGDPFWAAAGAVKDALDPDRILAPGRYDPHHHS